MKKWMLAVALAAMVLLCGCVPEQEGQSPSAGTLPEIINGTHTATEAGQTTEPVAPSDTDPINTQSSSEESSQPPATQPTQPSTQQATQPPTQQPTQSGTTEWTGDVETPPDIFD